MVLIDLQKAFDTVDHVILLKKLEAMGVSKLKVYIVTHTKEKQYVTNWYFFAKLVKQNLSYNVYN